MAGDPQRRPPAADKAAEEMATPGLIDTRTVGKLESFDGDASKWDDWHFKARAWMRLLPTNGMDMAACLTAAATNSGPMERKAYATPADEISVVVYGALIHVLSGRAIAIAKTVEEGNGFELWRRLFAEYEPDSGQRLMAILGGVISPKFSEKEDFLAQLEKWETLVRKYEDLSIETIGDNMKRAIILGHAPMQLRTLLRTQGIGLNNYADMKKMLRLYAETGRSYDNMGVETRGSGSAGEAMEIGMIYGGKPRADGGKPWQKGHGKEQGKSSYSGGGWGSDGYGGNFGGKSKGKGKGKGKAKGKGKGKGDGGGGERTSEYFAGECGFCKKWGHKRRDCRLRLSARDESRSGVSMVKAASEAGSQRQVGMVRYSSGDGLDTDSGSEDIPEEQEPRWVFGVRSCCAVERHREDYVVVDSGSDEHMCPTDWHPEAILLPASGANPLMDVQGGLIPEDGQKEVEVIMTDGTTGEQITAKSQFVVSASVREPLWSAGKIVQNNGIVHLEKGNSYMQFGNNAWIPLEMRGFRFIAKTVEPAGIVGMAAGAGSAAADDEAVPHPQAASSGAAAQQRAAEFMDFEPSEPPDEDQGWLDNLD